MPDRRCRECGAELEPGRRSPFCGHDCTRVAAERIGDQAVAWLEASPVGIDGRARWTLSAVAAAIHLEVQWLSGLLADIDQMEQELEALEAEARRRHRPVFAYVSDAGFAALDALRLWRSTR
jgi:hypothetical protein